MYNDKVSYDRIEKLHPLVRDEVKEIFDYINTNILTGNAKFRIAQGLRTFEEQATLYAQGRTVKGAKVTNAKAGYSYHNYGLAIDIVLMVDVNKDGVYESASWDRLKDFDGDKLADWMEVINYFKSKGWEWGGDWKTSKDYPHVEKFFGYDEKDLLKLHNTNKIDAAGYVII